MKIGLLAASALAALVSAGPVLAQGAALTAGIKAPRWTIFSDTFGTRVDYPDNVFSVDAGTPWRGKGRHLRSPDNRARLMVYVEKNEGRHTPASFVRTYLRAPRDQLDYDRIARRFFAISGVRDDEVFYSRCNFPRGVAGRMHCIYLAYPKNEEPLWSSIVTRISLSLRPSG